MPPPDPAVDVAGVVAEAEGWHRPLLVWLYDAWDRFNAQYFGGRLTRPYLRFSGGLGATTYGAFLLRPGSHGRSVIRLHAALASRSGAVKTDDFALALGLRRLLRDVLLHEMVHQAAAEAWGDSEPDDWGNGPRFAAECNRLGRVLGLWPVRPQRARDRTRPLPNRRFWPECVRPPGYYLGAEEAVARVCRRR
jgi:hypothetical protein